MSYEVRVERIETENHISDIPWNPTQTKQIGSKNTHKTNESGENLGFMATLWIGDEEGGDRGAEVGHFNGDGAIAELEELRLLPRSHFSPLFWIVASRREKGAGSVSGDREKLGFFFLLLL